jgi:hypothetical protein
MKKGEEDFFLFFPKVIKLGTFHGPPSLEPFKGHKHWNLLLATKH